MSSVLSIGTTHPQNFAGVGRDIAVMMHFGVTCFTVVAAVSAQDESGVVALHSLDAGLVAEQLAVMPWERISAVRIGALVTVENIAMVERFLCERDLPVVIDPVLGASRGGLFYDETAYACLQDMLLCLPTAIVTPNMIEAAHLLGVSEIYDDGMLEAATALRDRGARAVVLKGGHRKHGSDDLLVDYDGPHWFRGERIDAAMPGTGCTFAAALAAGLANQRALVAAVEDARNFVRSELLRASKGSLANITNPGGP